MIFGSNGTSLGGAGFIYPKDFPTLLGWWDANDPNADGTLNAEGSSVATWKDKSGNGLDLTQGTVANQPTFLNAFQNGKAGIEFGTSVATYLDSPVFSLSSSYTTYCVFYSTSTSEGVIWESSTSNPDAVVETKSGFVQAFVWNGSSQLGCSKAISLNTKYLVSFVYDADGAHLAQMWLNNAAATSFTTSTSAAANVTRRFGNHPTILTRYYRGVLMEILIYNGAHSTVDRQLIQRSLATKWNLTLS
jgi:hypothetical protein